MPSLRTNRRGFLALAAGLAACGSEPVAEEAPSASPKPDFKLIAHRGGVVGEEYAENSPGSLEAAVERGYWMVEVDIRESRDGRLVVQHDEDFRRFYGVDRTVAEMTWDEIAELRAEPGGSRPLEFHEFAALCKGRMRLMLDTKPPEHPPEFFEAMERALVENELIETAYVIGTPQSRERFLGKAKVGLDRERLQAAAEASEEVAARYYLFEHGRDLDAETVRAAQAMNVAVVPSINIFHYADLPDHMTAARADVERMIEFGVTEFQIDSPYDVWLL